jgi:hypothetical protein
MRKLVMLLITVVLGAAMIAGQAAAKPKGGTTKKSLNIKLNGSQEVPKGAPKGSGTAKIKLDSSKGQVCYTLTWKNIGTPTASHLHKAKKGQAGAIVVPLFTSGPPKHSGCVNAKKSLVAAIIKKPSDYYANIHTKAYPAGAIRGQL